MKAKVIAPVSISGLPRQIGEAVEVDENTFANLQRKGRLAIAKDEPDAEETEAETTPTRNRRPR